jgi:hypothetical protein
MTTAEGSGPAGPLPSAGHIRTAQPGVMNMAPYIAYQMTMQAEHSYRQHTQLPPAQSSALSRQTDIRLGEMAAAAAQLGRGLARPAATVRALVRRARTGVA